MKNIKQTSVFIIVVLKTYTGYFKIGNLFFQNKYFISLKNVNILHV